MATRPNITRAQQSQFMAALLAPLPADAEQADTPKYRKVIVMDMLMVWRHAMDDVRIAEAEHQAEAIKDRRSSAATLSDKTHSLFNTLLRAEAAQCLIPAPTATELRWKKRRLRVITGQPEVAAAIAADEKRLAGRA